MTIGRINQVTIPQGTWREPFCFGFLSKDVGTPLTICPGNPLDHERRTGRSTRPPETNLCLPRFSTRTVKYCTKFETKTQGAN